MSRNDDLPMTLEQFGNLPTAHSQADAPVHVQQRFSPVPIGAQRVAVRRDPAAVMARMKTLAAMAGDAWFYRYPVYNSEKGREEIIEGPSIKLANNLLREMGNCACECIVDDFGDFFMIYARIVDLETGTMLIRPLKQGKGQRVIKAKDPARIENMLLQIGASKAERNVIVKLFDIYADFAFREAKNALVDAVGKKPDVYRQRILDRLAELEIDVVRVERVYARKAEDWLVTDMAKIIAEIQAVSDGMADANTMWPPATEADFVDAREARAREREEQAKAQDDATGRGDATDGRGSAKGARSKAGRRKAAHGGQGAAQGGRKGAAAGDGPQKAETAASGAPAAPEDDGAGETETLGADEADGNDSEGDHASALDEFAGGSEDDGGMDDHDIDDEATAAGEASSEEDVFPGDLPSKMDPEDDREMGGKSGTTQGGGGDAKATGDQPAGDKPRGGFGSGTSAEIDAAYLAGEDARQAGKSIKDVPVEYTKPGKGALMRGWMEGWSNRDSELRGR